MPLRHHYSQQSWGDEAAGFALRDEQYRADLNRARLFVAGSVIAGNDAQSVRDQVNRNADRGANFIKTRIDDNLGRLEDAARGVRCAG